MATFSSSSCGFTGMTGGGKEVRRSPFVASGSADAAQETSYRKLEQQRAAGSVWVLSSSGLSRSFRLELNFLVQHYLYVR